MYYNSLASSPNTHLHTDNKFYLGVVCTRGCEIKSYKTKTNADKMCAKLNARAKQQKYIVTSNN